MRRAKWHPTAFGGERETKSSFLEQRLGGSIRGEQKRRLGLLSLPLPYSRALSLYITHATSVFVRSPASSATKKHMANCLDIDDGSCEKNIFQRQ